MTPTPCLFALIGKQPQAKSENVKNKTAQATSPSVLISKNTNREELALSSPKSPAKVAA